MTTEDDFQNALDKNPKDWQTRLVFADWLEERNDPRAEGYRALGLLKKYPRTKEAGDASDCPYFTADIKGENYVYSNIGKEWIGNIKHVASGVSRGFHLFPYYEIRNDLSRREVEDVVAIAFTTLPKERKEEILLSVV